MIRIYFFSVSTEVSRMMQTLNIHQGIVGCASPTDVNDIRRCIDVQFLAINGIKLQNCNDD